MRTTFLNRNDAIVLYSDCDLFQLKMIENNTPYSPICVKHFIVLMDNGSLYAIVKEGEEYVLIKYMWQR